MERQLLWNCIPDPEEEAVRWLFYIVNKPREIGRIQSKILRQLAPVWEVAEREGNIQDLKYKFIAFYSKRSEEMLNLDKTYRGAKIRDERRLDENRQDGVDGLVASLADSLKKGTL